MIMKQCCTLTSYFKFQTVCTVRLRTVRSKIVLYSQREETVQTVLEQPTAFFCFFTPTLLDIFFLDNAFQS